MQTNLFSEQIQQQNQLNTLSTTKSLLLASAIVSTIFSVPGLGFSIGLIFQIPMIAFLILSIFTLIFAKKARRSIIGSTLSIIANILSFLTFFILIYTLNLPEHSSANESATLLYTIVALITWAVFISASIVLFVEFNSANKTIIELQHYSAQQNTVYQPATPLQQTPPPIPQYQTPLTTPPFSQSNETQTESAKTPNTSINQTHVQAPHISTPPQQSNPFLTKKEEVQTDNLFIDHK